MTLRSPVVVPTVKKIKIHSSLMDGFGVVVRMPALRAIMTQEKTL